MKHTFLVFVLALSFAPALYSQATGDPPAVAMQIVMRWGVDLTTRLDTLSPLQCDSFGVNRSMFRFVTDSTYKCPYFPVVYQGMLLFADSAGNVQNIVVKSYDYTFYTGAVDKTGHHHNRQIMYAGLPIAKHKAGDKVKILRVECVDLNGRKMEIRIPPFYVVKYR